MVSIQMTAINITAINLQISGLDGTGVLPIQLYQTNCIVRLWNPICIISTSLAKIYRNYELYKDWQILNNIEQPCKIILDLWTLYGPI